MFKSIIILFTLIMSFTSVSWGQESNYLDDYCEGLDKSDPCKDADASCKAKHLKVIEDCHADAGKAKKEIEKDLKAFEKIKDRTNEIKNSSLTPTLCDGIKGKIIVNPPTPAAPAPSILYTVTTPTGCSELSITAADPATAIKALEPQCIQKCTAGIKPIKDSLEAAVSSTEASRENEVTCAVTHAKAARLCVLSSPQGQMGAMMMNQLTTSLAGSSAKETCDKTGLFSNMGNGVMAAGALICGKNKDQCIAKCKAANATQLTETQKQLAVAIRLLNSLGTNYNIAIATNDVVKKLDRESAGEDIDKIEEPVPLVDSMINTNTSYVSKCESYSSGQQALTQTAMGLLQSATQAKQCSEKLAGNAAEANQTMDQMCAKPANAASQECVCRANNMAPGCPGNVAAMKGEGNLKALNTGGVSKMAGLSYGSKPAVGKGSTGGLGDLTDEAKRVLAPPTDSGKLGNMFGGGSGAASAGSAGATAPGSSPDKGKGGGAAGEDPKSHSFATGVGAALKGAFGFGGGSGKSSDSKTQADKYKDFKRQIAADQAKSEISGASGMDNWYKIKMRYRSNVSSLMEGN